MSVKLNISPEKDAQEIAAVVRKQSTAFPRAQAFNLFRMAPLALQEKQKTYSGVLQDSTEAPRIRYLAAFNLCRLESRSGGKEVLELLEKEKDEHVISALAPLLGRCAPADAVRRIQTLAEKSKGFARQQLEFSLSLIAYRENLPEFTLPYPKSSELLTLEDSKTAVSMRLDKPNAAEFEHIRYANDDDAFGLEPSLQLSYKIGCNPNDWILSLDQKMGKPDTAEQLKKRKQILGALYFRNFSTGDYSLAYLLLSSPEKQECLLHLCSPKGMVKYAGKARFESAGLSFSIQSVLHAGATPVRFEGNFAQGSLQVTHARSGNVKLGRQVPQKSGE
ncbi:MAG: hypothetical protein JNJ57_14680 [Saprospiraceae bacterium]|nr:hypothetical protein [Saprospiraceae bacterium]